MNTTESRHPSWPAKARRRRLGVFVALTGLAGLTGLTACSSPTPSVVGNVSVTRPQLSSAIAQPTSEYQAENALPLNSYDVSASVQVNTEANNAAKVLTIQCMHSAGYPLYQGEGVLEVAQKSPSDDDTGGAWGYVDGALAADYGFATVRSTDSISGTPLPKNDPAEETAENKCFTSSNTIIHGAGVSPGANLVSLLESAAQQDTQQDSRYTTADAAWSACMKLQGFDTSSAAEFAIQNSTGDVSAANVTAAETDYHCTQQTNLGGIYFALLTGYQNELINENAQALATAHSAVQALSAQINKVLTGSTTSATDAS